MCQASRPTAVLRDDAEWAQISSILPTLAIDVDIKAHVENVPRCGQRGSPALRVSAVDALGGELSSTSRRLTPNMLQLRAWAASRATQHSWSLREPNSQRRAANGNDPQCLGYLVHRGAYVCDSAIVMPQYKAAAPQALKRMAGVLSHVVVGVAAVNEDKIERSTQRAPVQCRRVSVDLSDPAFE